MNYQSKPVSAYIMSRVITTTAYPHTNKKAIFQVAFIFHPTDPFAISVQRTNLEYVVNFHVRKPPQT